MPTLRQTQYKAKKQYWCDSCHKIINVGDLYQYLYGMAHEYEKPYVLRICQKCEEERLEYEQARN